MSCNGCRVLRKGCSDSCALRPCLQWIEGAEAQGHATVFVAKFFGRAGLMGFIAAVPDNQRPALFRSLLYEACGRTVNPVYGAVGLLWSNNWHICQAAVDSVLRGVPLKPPASSSPPASVPCYGPMPNLPRLHVKSHQQQQQQQQQENQDFKPLKALDMNINTSVLQQQQQQFHQHQREDTKPQVLNASRGFQPLMGRTAGIVVKRERDESVEIIAPVARRARVAHLPAVDDEPVIDLDLTLSSHPPTPQLILPPRGGNFAVNRVPSPSNSFSSEGSVTSLDTAEFMTPPLLPASLTPVNVSSGMDLLHSMERRDQRLLLL